MKTAHSYLQKVIIFIFLTSIVKKSISGVAPPTIGLNFEEKNRRHLSDNPNKMCVFTSKYFTQSDFCQSW